jgi:cobalt-zinc-cadmium resistance protein CzcA
MFRPQHEWVTAHSRNALIEAMKQNIVEHVPGVGLGFAQPIEMRFNELTAGVRSELAVKILGPDLDSPHAPGHSRPLCTIRDRG